MIEINKYLPELQPQVSQTPRDEYEKIYLQIISRCRELYKDWRYGRVKDQFRFNDVYDYLVYYMYLFFRNNIGTIKFMFSRSDIGDGFSLQFENGISYFIGMCDLL